MEILKPYRARIDELDEQILQLLRKRYDVIEEVADLKNREGIEAVLPDRVQEVENNAGRLAKDKGLDEAFIRQLYKQLIEHSCALEDTLMQKKAS